MEGIFRALAGLVGLLAIPLLGYGLFMTKAFGGFNSGSNSIPIFETTAWVFIIVMLLAFSIFGIPKNKKKVQSSPDDPDYIFTLDKPKDEIKSR
ncbi:hypothetical protein QEH59_18240 [Coraliomargarita sp. SDUM461004]|uniref:Cbb3-type cytochrome c oxidase subunit 3 n=1 Tax=Thalassobacterium sedimentorum TaxID=3041258 RepID=A0ABU1ANL1_9BACT|nr:hypothetical protein [Coraliomargarita sp. SDUM461004]MDQ8196376.1 hypothetical protein [Coraliomargarita sp. SDUM461004]